MEPIALEAPKSVTSEQVRAALAELLERQGEYAIGDDVVVKESRTCTGRKLYTVIAKNGSESVVKNALTATAGPYGHCGAGTWVLREAAILELFEKL